MNQNNLIKYYNTFKKSMIANQELENFKGSDNSEFTRLQRNATRYHNDMERIMANFSKDEMNLYMSVKYAFDTYAEFFTK